MASLLINQPDPALAANHVALLAQPAPSLLAGILEARVAEEDDPRSALPGPMGRPPRVENAGRLALGLYLNRSKVDSYPLLYTTLAVACPN